MVNKVILIGNLGKNPEVRSTQSGQGVTTFSMATSRRWKDTEGRRQEQTEWHSVVCFGRLAEVAGQYLAKGRQVCVEGRLQTRSWDDPETGKKRSRTEIVCENFQMLGNRPEAEAAEAEAPEPEAPAEAAEPAKAGKKTRRKASAKTRRTRAKKS